MADGAFTPREIDIELLFKRVQSGSLDMVQQNGELLQVQHIAHVFFL